jgi:molybdenum cofactor cytidylyltransferase
LIAPDRIVAAVLAAGSSTRFGGDKLLHPLGGKPLAAHIADTLAAMPFACRVAICPTNTPRAELFAARAFEIVENNDPARGMSWSLAIAATRARALKADALLVCLADMPAVTSAHLQSLIAVLNGSDAVATESAGIRMPPAVFARRVFRQLTTFTGDKGARDLLRISATVEASADLVRDYDNPADFA